MRSLSSLIGMWFWIRSLLAPKYLMPKFLVRSCLKFHLPTQSPLLRKLENMENRKVSIETGCVNERTLRMNMLLKLQ